MSDEILRVGCNETPLAALTAFRRERPAGGRFRAFLSYVDLVKKWAATAVGLSLDLKS
jgi:hypothetical protein